MSEALARLKSAIDRITAPLPTTAWRIMLQENGCEELREIGGYATAGGAWCVEVTGGYGVYLDTDPLKAIPASERTWWGRRGRNGRVDHIELRTPDGRLIAFWSMPSPVPLGRTI